MSSKIAPDSCSEALSGYQCREVTPNRVRQSLIVEQTKKSLGRLRSSEFLKWCAVAEGAAWKKRFRLCLVVPINRNSHAFGEPLLGQSKDNSGNHRGGYNLGDV